MIFNSYTFLVFLAIVLAVNRFLPGWTARKFFLLLVSYLFYAAWNPPFVLLLVFSTVLDWFLARWLYRVQADGPRRVLVVLSLAANLGLLGFFKYGNFLLDNLQFISTWLGRPMAGQHLNIILPVGISFYTFQTLSYTLDVYRRQMPPARSFLDYCLYVTFFPQLVAGPIVRASDFIPQCEAPRRATTRQLGWGMVLLVVGLFNKVVVADTLMAPVVDLAYRSTGSLGFGDAWLGTFAFATQIFCDFAGYSTCAIGVALCLGFELPDNFRFPYAAIGFSDFWARWHMSLSTWLRDYLYIPMGGNRRGEVRTYVNLMLTMLIGGLWHGASWLFVIWGGLHGMYLVVERLIRGWGQSRGWRLNLPGQVGAVLLTFLLTNLAWVFFRAGTMEAAGHVLSAMFTARTFLACLTPLQAVMTAGLTLAMLGVHFTLRNTHLEHAFARCPRPLSVVLVAGLAALTLFCLGKDGSNAFIYFQF